MAASAGIFKPNQQSQCLDHKKPDEKAIKTVTIYYPAIYSKPNVPNFNDPNTFYNLNILFAEAKGKPKTLTCGQDADAIMKFFPKTATMTESAIIALEVPEELLNPKPSLHPKALVSLEFKHIQPEYIVDVIADGNIYNKKIISTKQPIGGPRL